MPQSEMKHGAPRFQRLMASFAAPKEVTLASSSSLRIIIVGSAAGRIERRACAKLSAIEYAPGRTPVRTPTMPVSPAERNATRPEESWNSCSRVARASVSAPGQSRLRSITISFVAGSNTEAVVQAMCDHVYWRWRNAIREFEIPRGARTRRSRR
jgi:hypothetical protein